MQMENQYTTKINQRIAFFLLTIQPAKFNRSVRRERLAFYVFSKKPSAFMN